MDKEPIKEIHLWFNFIAGISLLIVGLSNILSQETSISFASVFWLTPFAIFYWLLPIYGIFITSYFFLKKIDRFYLYLGILDILLLPLISFGTKFIVNSTLSPNLQYLLYLAFFIFPLYSLYLYWSKNNE